MNKFVKIGVLVGTFVALAGDVYYVQHNAKSTSEQSVVLDGKINDLQNELKRLSESKEETKETIEVKLKNAVNAGKEVADLQNNYAKLNTKSKDRNIEDNADKLRKFFTKDTSNAGVPWLYINKDYIQGKLEPNWEFVTTYGFNPGKVDTLWINKDKTNGDIYAYTTAIYDSETGLFSQIKKVTTNNTSKLIGTNNQDTRSEDQKAEADRKAEVTNYEKYLLYIVCGSLVLVVSLGSFFYGNYNNKKIGKKNIEVSTLQNKVNATKQSDSLKVQAIISNENGLSQERLTKDKEILEKFMSDVFDWSSYKQYEEKRAKIMAQYNLKEDSTFMKVFMPKVVNENMNGKDYNRIDINGYNLKYQDMKVHVTKINTTEYSYFVEVNVVAKSENEGTAVGRTIFEATVNADGNIKDIKATLVTGE